MHAVLGQLVHAHRLERAGADVQRDVAAVDAARLQGVQQRLVEVQAGGRRGHRAGLAREHRLVARVVVRPSFAMDVGRQRQATGVLQPGLERLVDVEGQAIELALASEHFGVAAGIQRDAAAGLRRLARAHLRPRLVPGQQAFDEDLDAPAAGLRAVQAGRDHARVVEDQQVAGLQQVRQVADAGIAQGRGRGRHHQQAARGALGQGRLRDQLGRQVVMEVGALQGGWLRPGPLFEAAQCSRAFCRVFGGYIAGIAVVESRKFLKTLGKTGCAAHTAQFSFPVPFQSRPFQSRPFQPRPPP